jgi:hypothetical protein
MTDTADAICERIEAELRQQFEENLEAEIQAAAFEENLEGQLEAELDRTRDEREAHEAGGDRSAPVRGI